MENDFAACNAGAKFSRNFRAAAAIYLTGSLPKAATLAHEASMQQHGNTAWGAAMLSIVGRELPPKITIWNNLVTTVEPPATYPVVDFTATSANSQRG